ncbi:MAG: TonB-dependent siderophore receptor [Pseudomonadota bacterium]
MTVRYAFAVERTLTLKRLKTITMIGAASLPMVLISPAALAQTSGQAEEETTLDAVTVTGKYLYTDQVNALKSPTPIVDVPQSLSITTAEQIIQQGFDSIGDIVLYTPGVTQSQGEGHRDAVVFRGVRSTADFFVDGVRDDVQYYRSLYNLEQVEILRGPNALFFGRGGTGGILNRVTKKGVIGEQFVGYLAGVDTFGGGTVQLDGNYTVNDRAAVRVNAYYERLNNHRDFFDGDRFGINPTAFIELTPRTTLNLSYEYANNERFVDRGIPAGADGRPAEELADITFSDSELATSTLEAHIGRANLTHEFLDNLKGNFSVAYSDFDKLYLNFFPVSFDETTNIVGIDGYVDTTQRQSLTLSANLIGEFSTSTLRHTIVTGGEFIDTVNNNDRFNTSFDQTQDDVEFFLATRPIDLAGGVGVNASGNVTTNSFTTDLNDDTEADVTVYSAYIQDEIEVAPWLDLILGVRFDSFDITVDNIETFIETGEVDITSRTDSQFSPRLGFVLKPQETISIYGSFSESFLPRSGEQFADLPDDPATPDDETLDPDTFQNLEIGVKWDIADRFSLTAAFFEIEQSSPQEAPSIIDPETGIVIDDNAGMLVVVDSEIRGFEAQVQGQITDNWSLSAGYSYLEGDQVATTDILNEAGEVIVAQGEENGLRLRELPEHTFNLWSNYQITPKFGIGAGLTFQDESFADFGNLTTLPSFVRVDAAAHYDVTDNVRIQVNIENLTDTEYFPNSHTANNITVGAPINARFTVTGRF